MRKGDVDSLDATLPHIFIFSKERRSFFSILSYAGEKGGFKKSVNYFAIFLQPPVNDLQGQALRRAQSRQDTKAPNKEAIGGGLVWKLGDNFSAGSSILFIMALFADDYRLVCKLLIGQACSVLLSYNS